MVVPTSQAQTLDSFIAPCDRESLNTLLQYKKGSLLVVKDDKIQIMSAAERLKFKIGCLFGINLEEKTKLRNKINEFVESLRDNISNVVLDEHQARTIEILFLDRMSLLSKEIFDRSKIKLPKLEKIGEEITLYSFLLKAAQTEKSKALELKIESKKDPKSEQYPTLSLSKNIKKAVLSLRLGLKPELGNGCSGSYLIRKISPKVGREYIGIFKPKDEESLSVSHHRLIRSIINIFFRNLFLFGSRYKSSDGKGYIAEEGVYRISEDLGLGIVPPTTSEMSTALYLGGVEKTGSFQVFVHECQSAKKQFEVTKSFVSRPCNQHAEVVHQEAEVVRQELEKFIILNYITGNTDAHAENCLFDKKDKVFSIDGGMAFPIAQAATYIEKKYFNAVVKLPILQDRRFSDKGIQVIKRAYAQWEQLEATVRNIYEGKEDISITEARIFNMKQRILLLYFFCVLNNQNISDLKDLKSESEITNYLTIPVAH